MSYRMCIDTRESKAKSNNKIHFNFLIKSLNIRCVKSVIIDMLLAFYCISLNQIDNLKLYTAINEHEIALTLVHIQHKREKSK